MIKDDFLIFQESFFMVKDQQRAIWKTFLKYPLKIISRSVRPLP